MAVLAAVFLFVGPIESVGKGYHLDVPGVHVATPESTFYLFPNVTEAVEALGHDDVADFATAALHHTGVSFCTRHHFGTRQADEDQHYIRLAYSGIDVDAIDEGLGRLADWVGSA